MKTSLFAVLLVAAGSAAVAQDNYHDWAAAGKPPLDVSGQPAPPVEGGGLVQYPDRPSFEAAAGAALPIETFDNGATGTGVVNTCTEPVSSASNDVCFAPGDLIDGFSMTSSSGSGIVVLGANFLGGSQTTPVSGANSFPDFTMVDFTAADVDAVGIDAYSGSPGAGDVTVRAFDAADALIGSIVVTTTATNVPEFAGFTSAVPVSRIEIEGANDSGELLDNLQFGAVTAEVPESQPVPVLGLAGLLGLGALLLMAGLLGMRRRLSAN